ncbi:uncharacterized protein LOC116416234 [Nasonia vitripennis]|uniref:Uncharacterized protein n=1 Tax=Nasonia vitripennis TaxID=7425 RepID=A0A7M7Q2V0_NASVI|nr:uncharacterized protein LOC116416234 [Nasonia vitripennis]
MQECIDYLKDNRHLFSLRPENPYLFGLPSKNVNRPRYIRATQILPSYAEKSGVKNHLKVRGTFLRKHLATFCSAELSDQEFSSLAKFMGDKDSTHRDFYRLSDKLRDLMEISQYLEKAQGNLPNESKIWHDDNQSTSTTKTSGTHTNTKSNKKQQLCKIEEHDEPNEETMESDIKHQRSEFYLSILMYYKLIR